MQFFEELQNVTDKGQKYRDTGIIVTASFRAFIRTKENGERQWRKCVTHVSTCGPTILSSFLIKYQPCISQLPTPPTCGQKMPLTCPICTMRTQPDEDIGVTRWRVSLLIRFLQIISLSKVYTRQHFTTFMESSFRNAVTF